LASEVSGIDIVVPFRLLLEVFTIIEY